MRDRATPRRDIAGGGGCPNRVFVIKDLMTGEQKSYALIPSGRVRGEGGSLRKTPREFIRKPHYMQPSAKGVTMSHTNRSLPVSLPPVSGPNPLSAK